MDNAKLHGGGDITFIPARGGKQASMDNFCKLSRQEYKQLEKWQLSFSSSVNISSKLQRDSQLHVQMLISIKLL